MDHITDDEIRQFLALDPFQLTDPVTLPIMTNQYEKRTNEDDLLPKIQINRQQVSVDDRSLNKVRVC